VTRIQFRLRDDERRSLHEVARRSGRSLTDLIREAIRRVWLRGGGEGPVGLWDGVPRRTSVEHDTVHDDPRRERGRAHSSTRARGSRPR
jgi:hypothetical protein